MRDFSMTEFLAIFEKVKKIEEKVEKNGWCWGV